MAKVIEYAKIKNSANKEPNAYMAFWRTFYDEWATQWPFPALMDIVKRECEELAPSPPEGEEATCPTNGESNDDDPGEGQPIVATQQATTRKPKKSRGPMTVKLVSNIFIFCEKYTYANLEA